MIHHRFIQWLDDRASSLATFAICARKIRVIRGYKLGGLQATKFSLSWPIEKKWRSGQRIREKTEVSIFIAIY
ncbi:MAG: hypothetical protein DME69_08795 [Verrucomicrobia bacterium]|nr:MAG: hypothetical protein DME69_08795 [Verrucomicrobiota bacterium]